MKLTEGSAEHLQPNSACLPPQHPENSPTTSCLEENRHFPQASVLQSLFDVISRAGCFYKILPLCLSLSFPQRLNCLNAPSIDCLNPGHRCLLLFPSLHWLLNHFHYTFNRLSLHSHEAGRENRHCFIGGWKCIGSLISLAQVYFHRLATTMKISGTSGLSITCWGLAESMVFPTMPCPWLVIFSQILSSICPSSDT